MVKLYAILEMQRVNIILNWALDQVGLNGSKYYVISICSKKFAALCGKSPSTLHGITL